jgi:hypothetical protein
MNSLNKTPLPTNGRLDNAWGMILYPNIAPFSSFLAAFTFGHTNFLIALGTGMVRRLAPGQDKGQPAERPKQNQQEYESDNGAGINFAPGSCIDIFLARCALQGTAVCAQRTGLRLLLDSTTTSSSCRCCCDILGTNRCCCDNLG